MTDSVFKSSFSFVSVRRDSVLLLEKVTPKSQWQYTHKYTHTYTHTYRNECILTYSYADTHTHTHHNLQMSVVCEALARALSETRSFWGRKKRETRKSHLDFSCLHSEVTQMTPPMSHCPE